jgi:hypothetical protein
MPNIQQGISNNEAKSVFMIFSLRVGSSLLSVDYSVSYQSSHRQSLTCHCKTFECPISNKEYPIMK